MRFVRNKIYWYYVTPDITNPDKVELLDFDYLSPNLPCYIKFLNESGTCWCSADKLKEATAHELHQEKQIEALRDIISGLEDKLSSIEEKHQEELGNYNSVAAADIETRYQDEIEFICTNLEKYKTSLVLFKNQDELAVLLNLIDSVVKSLKEIEI